MQRFAPCLVVCLGLLAYFAPASAARADGAIAWQPFTLESFHDKSLAGELGTIQVPERRDGASGQPVDPARTLDLSFVRLPTTATAPGAPIVYLDGGPGSSPIRLARVPGYFEAFEALTGVADVILLDQRGTGKSDPGLFCPPPEGPPPTDVFVDPEKLERRMLQRLEACSNELAAKDVDLAAYTTRESADDLEDLRRALGAERLNLLGFSYGTHLGLAAIRRHPASLQRVALIGVEGPNHTRKLPSSLDTQVRKLSLLAAKDPTIGDQVPDMYGLLQKVLAKLEEAPITVPITLRDGTEIEVPVGPQGLQMILNWDLGDGNDFPVFPALLTTIDQGDPSLLAWFVRKRGPRLSGGVPALYFAVDGASGASPERWARIARETPYGILGNVANGLFPKAAEAMGIEPLPESFRGPITSDVETLFITGTLDSNSPPYQAEEVRWGFARSDHLIIDHAGHEDMLVHAEVHAVLVDFFAGDDVSDRRVALPAPRFLSVTEAKAQRLGAR
ncbi:MAG: alpha/beta hydrolase [Acidobacteriota bacterium]